MPLNLSWAVFTPVLKIFGVLTVGLLFRKYSKLDAKPITDVTMAVFVPCLAFASIMSQEIVPVDFRSMVGASLLTIAGTGLLALAVFRLFRIRGRGIFLAIMFLNAANFPFPLIDDLYGAEGLFRGVLYYTAVSAMIFSLGIFIVSRTTNLLQLLRVPSLLAVMLAIALNFLGVKPPGPLMEIVGMLGQAAVPLILFVFGYALYSVRLKHIKITLISSILRIAGGLLMGIVSIHLFNIDGLSRHIVLIYSIMPSAVINVIICKKYDADAEAVASTVLLTTALSLMTIPLMLAYLGH